MSVITNSTKAPQIHVVTVNRKVQLGAKISSMQFPFKIGFGLLKESFVTIIRMNKVVRPVCKIMLIAMKLEQSDQSNLFDLIFPYTGSFRSLSSLHWRN